MPPPHLFPQLKESQLRRLASPSLITAGTRLWRDGQVRHGLHAHHEPLLMALVQDHAVRVRHLAGEEFTEQCDCGADGMCAHAAALLMAWVNESHSFDRVEGASDVHATQANLRFQWRHYLQAANLSQLRAMARRLDMPPNGAERASLVAQVAERLSDPGAPARAIAAQNEAQRRVLQMLYLLSDGQTDTTAADLQAALGWLEVGTVEEALRELRDWGLVVSLPSQWFRSDPYTVAPNVARHVPRMVHGLASADGEFDQARIGLVMPFEGDLAALERQGAVASVLEVLLLARHLSLEERPEPPELAQAQSIKALREWTYDLDEMVRLQVRPGWMHQTDSVLSVPPPDPRLSDHSLEELRPLTLDDELSDYISHLLVQPTEQGGEMTDLREAFDAWQRNTTWTEFWTLMRAGVVSVKRAVLTPNLTYAAWLVQLARARRFITRALALLPAEQWFDAESFLAYIHTVHADFLRERQLAPLQAGWWLERGGQRVDPQAFAVWRETYGAFAAQIISGPLRWLGAAEIALERTAEGSRLRAFRLTAVGEALLRGSELPAPTALDRPLRLLDAQTAQLPLARNDFFAYRMLERMSRFECVCEGHAQYRFEEARAHAGFEGGLTLSDVLACLADLSGAPLPEALRAQWEDWWARYAQVRWYDNLTVLEFADDYMLQELLAQTDLREHVLITFGPRLIVVRPESADALTRTLIKKGYTPRIE